MNPREYELLLLESKKTASQRPPESLGSTDFDLMDLMTVAAGTASAELVAKVAAFIQQRPNSEVEQFLRTYKQFAQGDELSPPDSEPTSLIEQMKQADFSPPIQKKTTLHRVSRYAGAAALLVMAAALVILVWQGMQRNNTRPNSPGDENSQIASGPSLEKVALIPGSTNRTEVKNQASLGEPGIFTADPQIEYKITFSVKTKQTRGVMYRIRKGDPPLGGIFKVGVFNQSDAGILTGSYRAKFDQSDREDLFLLVLVDPKSNGSELAESLDSLLIDEMAREQLFDSVGRIRGVETVQKIIVSTLTQAGVSAPVAVQPVATVIPSVP